MHLYNAQFSSKPRRNLYSENQENIDTQSQTLPTPDPWNVDSFDDFCFYCCPECDYRSKTKNDLVNHAIENHPKSKNLNVSQEHSYANEKDKEKKMEKTILEIVRTSCIDIPSSTPNHATDDEKQPINIDSLSDRQLNAILGVNRNTFNLYFLLIKNRLKEPRKLRKEEKLAVGKL
jgi:hypothetical protein